MNEALRPAPPVSPQPSDIPIVSVVVPTFNERDNVTTLYRRLETAFKDVPWEVVFVDDNSPDGTWQVVRDLSRNDPRVRCIRRIGRRGLSGACIEGILAASAPFAAVIDADLQHDETQLPKMLALLQSGAADAADTRASTASGPGPAPSPPRSRGARSRSRSTIP
jgi:dolichol-phosphate mannosyltransferase